MDIKRYPESDVDVLNTLHDSKNMFEEMQRLNRQKKPYHLVMIQLTNIPKINEKFDLVFIDADKENYLNYYHLIIDKMQTGGFILADNTLWSGKVVEKTPATDKDTLGLKAFNDFVQQDERVENVLLPLRDGLMLVRKL